MPHLYESILLKNTSVKENKHDKVRARCVAYFGYLLFGIELIAPQTLPPKSPALRAKHEQRKSEIGGYNLFFCFFFSF